jgi:hypothetical protein
VGRPALVTKEKITFRTGTSLRRVLALPFGELPNTTFAGSTLSYVSHVACVCEKGEIRRSQAASRRSF